MADEIQPINWMELNPHTQQPVFAALLNARAAGRSTSESLADGRPKSQTFLNVKNVAAEKMIGFLKTFGVALEGAEDSSVTPGAKGEISVRVLTEKNRKPQPGKAVVDAVENANVFRIMAEALKGYDWKAKGNALIETKFIEERESIKRALIEQGIGFALEPPKERDPETGVQIESKSIEKFKKCIEKCQEMRATGLKFVKIVSGPLR